MVRRNFQGKKYNKRKDKTLAHTKKDANQDKRLEKVEKKIHNLNSMIELKYIDGAFTATAGTSGVLSLLNGTIQDTTSITRIGSDIFMTSIQLHGTMSSIDTRIGGTVCRLMLVLDRQANGINPTIAGNPNTAGVFPILDSGATGTVVDSPRAYQTVKRFKILWDKRYVFNPATNLTVAAGATTAVVTMKKRFDKYFKLNQIVKYSNADDFTILGINRNALFLVAITDIANGVTFTGGSRMYFKDL